MKRSLAYAFILNMWMMDRVDASFVESQLAMQRLTPDEATMIMATPKAV